MIPSDPQANRLLPTANPQSAYLVDDSQLSVNSSSFFSPCSAGQLYHAPPKTNTGHLLSRQKHQISSNKSIKKNLNPQPMVPQIQNHRPMAQYGPGPGRLRPWGLGSGWQRWWSPSPADRAAHAPGGGAAHAGHVCLAGRAVAALGDAASGAKGAFLGTWGMEIIQDDPAEIRVEHSLTMEKTWFNMFSPTTVWGFKH